jgi:cyclic beta-1,2-glucan synthetase
VEQLESYARELAADHEVSRGEGRRKELLTRLERNAERLEHIYKKLSEEGFAQAAETSSEQWLRDNHYVVRAQVQEIRRNLPRQYYEELPTLTAGRWRRYPRVYVLAREFVSRTAGRFDQELLRRFADAYQEVTSLSIGELWAIPIMLRLALLENLCGLAVQTLRAKEEREAARRFATELLAEPGRSNSKAPIQLAAKASSTFVVEILHSLRDQSVSSTAAWQWLQGRLTARGQSPDDLLRSEQQREAVDQLSIANIITTMRVLSALEWPVFVEAVSHVERILRRDPAGAYADMDIPTRDRYRKSVEQLSKRSKVDESEIAERVVAFAETARREQPGLDRTHHVGYYLISRGRFELERAVGYPPTIGERVGRITFRHPALGYLGSVALTTAIFESSLLIYARNHGASWRMVAVVAILTLLPVSELALSFLNTILTTILPPRPLPKLSLRGGIPDELRTVVVVPTILSSVDRVRELTDALEVRSLANHEENLSFALLGDFSDAPAETQPGDAAIVDAATTLITGLNKTHGAGRFYLFHRKRLWNPSEQRWIGWERKRGKLHELNRFLRGATDTTFVVKVGDLERLKLVRFVITLDSDTELPLDAGRKLVGTLAHPLNRPRLDRASQRVTEGYGILQPRVAISAVSASRSIFSQVFSGHVGLDPYTTAVSDVYQDLFQEGSYVGKGIYDVDAFEAALAGRVPENTLLSHDLFEGLFARVALCTDLEVIDDYPNHYLTSASRLHRWVRGDWQLLPWLGTTLSAIGRWKLLDNLRRSLLPLSLIAVLTAGWLILPGGPSLWVTLVFLVLFFPVYVQWGQSLSNRIQGVGFRDHVRAERETLQSSLHQVLLTSAFLAHQSFVMADAIGRTLIRLLVTRRHLLEWVTAADAAESLQVDQVEVFRRMWAAPALAVALGVAVSTIAPESLWWAVPVLALWAASPVLAYRTGLPKQDRQLRLDAKERTILRRAARLTWRFFEEVVGPTDNWLVPDNYQENRPDPVAHRTSPTNIGLQLLADVAAWDFGYISATQALERLERTLATLQKLSRYRGHLFNWYDTQTLAPLPPLYVSTVDSGNLLGYLMTLKMALPAIVADAARIDRRFQEGLADTIDLFERDAAAAAARDGREALRLLRANLARLRSRFTETPGSSPEWTVWLEVAASDLARLAPAPGGSVRSGDFWLRSAQSMLAERQRTLTADYAAGYARRAEEACAQIERLVNETEFAFLFDRQRQLFTIGYNLTEGRRDSSCYDTLASEARLGGFLAIATRHVPQEHWFRMSRSMAPVGHRRALISWSASMFEYLMPLLVMRTYPHTLLDETYEAVVDRQIEYGREMSVPWGISESAYNFQDPWANYQYRAFGVPGLGLKQGLADDLVIAPYATMLAAQVRPRDAIANLEQLTTEGAQGPMGFYEAIDYTPERLPEGTTDGVVVKTYMAHHQAMSLLALDNCLNGNLMQQRFHAEPRVQAAELLLQERSPRLAPLDPPPEEHKVDEVPGRSARSLIRRYVTPHTLSPRAHLLSNGSYSVMVTNSGAGYSRWRDLSVTRWREDATTDAWGSFCYVRDLDDGEFWSGGFNPSGTTPDAYEVTFAPDRAVLRRRDRGIETHTEVAVSPEDDVEIRRVSLTNHSRVTRELELTSYAEVVLAPQGQDLAHPTFSNLFIESMAVPDHNGIICSRRPRAKESRLYLGHVLAGDPKDGTVVEFETDREHFVGRGTPKKRPAAMTSDKPLRGATGAVLDPIVSLRVKLRVPAGGTARVSFTTAVADNEDGIRALIEKYHDPQVISRAFALASTHSEIELRHLGMTREDESRFQRLAGRLIFGDPRLRTVAAVARNTSPPSGLWKFGVSGDLPIVLVTIADAAETGLAQELIRCQEFLRARGMKCDLVILNEIPTSYRQDVQDELQKMAEAGPSHAWIDRPGGLYLRRSDAMTEQDQLLLRAVARVVLDGARGTLNVQLARPMLPPAPPPLLKAGPRKPWLAAFEALSSPTQTAAKPGADLQFFNGVGGFTQDGREYQVTALPPNPWSNVVANARFGFVATESGLGYTWSENSFQNRLTPWSNDPIVDPAGEAVYLRDDETGERWSATPSPAGRPIAYTSRFGQGYVAYEHAHDGMQAELLVFVPREDTVKIVRLRIENRSAESRRLSAFYYVDWCLSDTRTRSAGQIVTSVDPLTGALFAKNAFRLDFGSRVAFLDTPSTQRWVTGDRASFIGRNRSLEDPEALLSLHLSGRVGPCLDACGAIQARFILKAGATTEVLFVLGEGVDEEGARSLIAKYRSASVADTELEQVRQLWDERLSAIEVRTPDGAMDLLVNRWLQYQTLSCRVHARSAFYQSGGAFGFRDQLQDVLAVAHFDPQLARQHIVRAASRQFPEGDVQHWWHEPGGEGVRTHIQDDRLWLLYAALEYARMTGDLSIFDENVSFIEQRPLPPGEHSAYERPARSALSASLYEHCVRAVEATLATGERGLPLMGTGDWNDGMDEVGAEGRGESVWLGWFLGALLPRLAALAAGRGDKQKAELYTSAAARLGHALDAAWDGDWYRRAYFDDGTPLGSSQNSECKIDAIAQAWSVISGMGRPDRAAAAMHAVDSQLVDRKARLILLLSPPFDRAEPNPGYIRGYVPGVRENGGQYTHAALWAVLAQAMLGDGDRAYEMLRFINPVERASSLERVATYRVEPYVVAADIYSAAGHVGRGGWTWYTGAAGWMYRVMIEHILGVKREGGTLRIDPCVPREWQEFNVVLRLPGAEYHVRVENPRGVSRGVTSTELDTETRPDGLVPLVSGSGRHLVRVVLG